MYDVSLIITTHSRAGLLRQTLASVAGLAYPGTWETVVVDNNSTDETPDVVADARRGFPVPLRRLTETCPGKYAAFNTGIAHTDSTFVANTDDDVALPEDWLSTAVDGLSRDGNDFVGGPVYPRWEIAPPRWITDGDPSICGKVLALQDHGREPRRYGVDGISWPLGVNVAYRRDAFARVGLFDPRLGRAAGTLRNQSQREWHLRARAGGLRGRYLPDMWVRHFVPAERLTRAYFLRWFYWHGISRAIMHSTSGTHMLEPEGPSDAAERHVLGVPLPVWRTGLRATGSAAMRWLTGRSADALEYELQIAFLAGAIHQGMTQKRGAHHRSRPQSPSSAGDLTCLSDR